MTEKRISKMFWLSIAVTLVIKVLLAIAIPLTSDEAYFVVWAKHLDFGYYDHPPMVGWILYLMSFVGHSPVVMRLPAILSTLLIGIGIYELLRSRDKVAAGLVGTLFIVSPINILNVLITTDTPLILFSFLSALFLFLALKKENYLYYFLAGIALGLAFLSKYFAILLGIAYALYLILTPKKAGQTKGFVLLFAAVIPFALINLYWNYTHCWANILFNLFNRNEKESFSFVKVLIFIVSQAYLMMPPALYFLFRKRKELSIPGSFRGTPLAVFAFAFAVPICAFALLSTRKIIGLHWVLAFYAFYYIVLCLLLSKEELFKSIRFMAVFSLIHLLLIGTALSIPLHYFKANKNYPAVIMGTRPEGIVRYLRQYDTTFHFATPSYANSAEISYYYGKYFSVFGGGSLHGRQDDLLTDFRKWQGENVLILRNSEPKADEYGPFFDRIEINRVVISEAPFYIVLGYGFNYENYRARVLTAIKDKYYSIPSFLPCAPLSCYFYDKYFNELRPPVPSAH